MGEVAIGRLSLDAQLFSVTLAMATFALVVLGLAHMRNALASHDFSPVVRLECFRCKRKWPKANSSASSHSLIPKTPEHFRRPRGHVLYLSDTVKQLVFHLVKRFLQIFSQLRQPLR